MSSVETPNKKPKIPCDICGKRLCNLKSLKRHKATQHNIRPPKPNFKCSDCSFFTSSLGATKTHMEFVHQSKDIRWCGYCNTVCSSTTTFVEHVKRVHGLPVWKKEGESEINTIPPIAEAFNGNVQSYEIETSNDVDLLELFIRKKPDITSIIEDKVMESPQKVQFLTEISFMKPVEGSGNNEQITIYVNTKMQSVFVDGLDDDAFYEMVEQILVTTNNFASHGSGWTVSNIDRIIVNTLAFSPIRAGTFLELPPELRKEHFLLNIKTRNDERCFAHCYAAAHSLNHGPALYETHDYRSRVNPSTYSEENPLAKQPLGEFTYPMSIHQMKRFETMNNVKVNIFR